MELIKYKSSEVVSHIRHDLREMPEEHIYGNEAVDTSLSHLNYSLVNKGANYREINKYRHKIEKETFCYKRKDVVHAVEVVLQCPKDCPEEQKFAFFKESYNYLVSTLPMGEKAVILAEVHRDEKHCSPTGEMISKEHLHLMYIPAVKDHKHEGYDYKLCADQLTKRSKLRELHPGLQAHLDECGIHATVWSGKHRDGKEAERAISLTTSQLKELTAATGVTLDHSLTVSELSEIIKNNIESQARIDELVSKLDAKNRQIEALKSELERVQKSVEHEASHEWGSIGSWGDKSQSWNNNNEEEQQW